MARRRAIDLRILGSGLRDEGSVKLLRKGETVHGIHTVKKTGSAARFVALQMADQMPGGAEIRNVRLLCLPLLDAVFAKVAQARIVSGANRVEGKSLRHRNNRYIFEATPCAFRSSLNLSL